MSASTTHIAHIRQDYTLAALDESITGNDPLAFFHRWFDEAQTAQISEVNAMTLATVSAEGKPHARIVLLKGVEHNGFIFFTNYDSNKGRQIASHDNAALLFFWKELERQVRVEGKIRKISAEESDQYFHSRPAGSRIGAWSSPQSQVISDRSVLDKNYQDYEAKFADTTIPRPPHWGGYIVEPMQIEFWQGRSSRMHDRILFTRSDNGTWEKARLAP